MPLPAAQEYPDSTTYLSKEQLTPDQSTSYADLPKQPFGLEDLKLPIDTQLRLKAEAEKKFQQITEKRIAVDRSPKSVIYSYDLPILNLHPDLAGTTILQLGDPHYSRSDDRNIKLQRRLREVATKAAFEPDFVIATGDYVTNDPSDLSRDAVRELELLFPNATRLFTLGNHDYKKPDKGFIRRQLARIDFQDITNTVLTIQKGDATLRIIGVDDCIGGDPLVPIEMDEHSTNLLFTHNPDVLVQATTPHLDAVFASHLHSGEFKLGPFSGITGLRILGEYDNLNEHVVGFKALSRRTLLYISPCLATHTKRFGDVHPAGITFFRLVPYKE